MSFVQYGWVHSFKILVNVRSNDYEYTQIQPKLDADDISKHAGLRLRSIREKSESLFRVKAVHFHFKRQVNSQATFFYQLVRILL